MTIEEAKKVILSNLPVMSDAILKEAVDTVFDALNKAESKICIDLPGEVWKDIEGYEGLYQVSNKGRVKSLNFLSERILRGSVSVYCRVGLYKDGICKGCFSVHRLVAQVFIPNPENKPFVNHIDGNKHNNFVENLEWSDALENARHAIRTGLKKANGTFNVNAKFNAEEIKEIREIYKPRDKNFGQAALAKKYGVHHDTIQKIVNHKTYKNVK